MQESGGWTRLGTDANWIHLRLFARDKREMKRRKRGGRERGRWKSSKGKTLVRRW